MTSSSTVSTAAASYPAPAGPKIVIARHTFPNPDEVIAHYQGRAVLAQADISTAAQAATATAGADALVVATQRLDSEILRALSPSVRVIGRTGVGLDTVDLPTAAELGIAVVNQPAYGAVEVASHAVAMLVSLQRRLQLSDRYVRGGWSGPLVLAPMRPLDELTLGLLGCGRIGAETARLAAPLVAEVVAYDPFATELPAGVRRVDQLADLLSVSNLLSIHSPLTEDTRGLLGAAELALLPDDAVLVNVARGGIIDETALADRLHSGQLAGAGLDVFAGEPLAPDSPLLHTPNTWLSPHVAAYSERAMWRLASWTIDDLLGWLAESRISNGNLAVAGTR